MGTLYDYIPNWLVEWVPGAAEERRKRQIKTVLVIAGAAFILSKVKK
ncbi:hypothetical protein PsW64_03815 [Pseudovibrio sp. W64]|nr:hypothetical protein [Pseudovibrio sp. W64]KZK78176.1 hypothetical protein PsW64_03815 [Pseudovibrio sp. W64]